MRRVLLTAFAAATICAAAAPAVTARAGETTAPMSLLEPYGEGSLTDRVIAVLKPALEKTAGQSVTVEHAGPGSLNQVAHAAPDGRTAVVVGLLPVELAAIRANPGVKVTTLTPIAKLTGPYSVVLVVPDSSPLKNWSDFAAASRARPLSIASPGRDTAAGLAIAMMERVLGVQFNDIIAQQRSEILAALKSNKADAGFLETMTLDATPQSPAPPVQPIVTFGAERNPSLDQVPTFQEAIGPQPPDRRHNAITSTVGLFGPPGMKPQVVSRLDTEFTAAGANAERSDAPAASHLSIEIGDAALLRATMARDEAVIKELIGTMH
jgi:tripartite-type tricarboxylate transporter receptor subunit TctC